MKRVLNIFIFLLCIVNARSQLTSSIEKLEKDVKNGKEDTNKVSNLLNISNLVGANNFKKAISSATEALELSQKLNYFRGIANSYSGLADAYWYHADFEEAQKYYFKSYLLNDSIHYERGTAMALYNIGWILAIQQQNYKEDSYLYRSMAILRKLQDTSGLLQIYNAMGSYFKGRFNESKFKDKQFFDSSLKYFKAGELIAVNPKYKNNVGRIYSNMSNLYGDAGDFKSALYYINQSSTILLSINDTASYTISCLMRARFLLDLKHPEESREVFKKVLDYAESHEMKQISVSALQGLASCYYALGNYKEAFNAQSKYIELNEEVNQQVYSTNLKEMQGKYDLDKSETSLKELKQAGEIQELKNKQNTYFIFILLAVAIIVIVVAVLLFRQNKLKNNANVKLQEQNTIISEKKQEIDKSIQYAKGIQNAVLPDIGDLKKQFNESFIFYHPKDVVSGDFYWIHDTENYFYAIAADCTGHGVPGALMSIVSMDKLNQAIFEKKLLEPTEILRFLNIEIKRALKQQSDEAKQKDGLDIALVRFDKNSKTALFAGANRPLYLVRDKKLSEFKADKVAIAGFTANEFEFHQQEIKLEKNDCLYLSSDGYADQFGGPDAKKFMTKNFKSLLEQISGESMAEQESKLVDSHQQWKGNYEQVDDILVIGIKI